MKRRDALSGLLITQTFDASARPCSTALDHDVSRRGAYASRTSAAASTRCDCESSARTRSLPASAGSLRLHLPVRAAAATGRPVRAPGERPIRDGRRRRDPRRRAGRCGRAQAPARPLGRPRGRRSAAGSTSTSSSGSPASGADPTVGRWVVDADGARRGGGAPIRAAVEASGPLGLDVAPLDDRDRAVLAALDGVAAEAGRARRPWSGAGADPLADHPFVAALEAQPFAPPSPPRRRRPGRAPRAGPSGPGRRAGRGVVRGRGRSAEAAHAMARMLAATTRRASPSSDGPGRARDDAQVRVPLLAAPRRDRGDAPAGDLRIAGPGCPPAWRRSTGYSPRWARSCLRSTSFRPPQMPWGSRMRMA